MPTPTLKADQYHWVRLYDNSSPLYTVDYEQTVLGYDRKAGTFNMILRCSGNDGHCNRHQTRDRAQDLREQVAQTLHAFVTRKPP